MFGPRDAPSSLVAIARQRIFFIIFISAMICGTLGLAFNIWIAHKAGKTLHVAIYTMIYAGILFVCLERRIGYLARVWTGLLILFLLGAFSHATFGPAGSGRMWLLAFSITAGLLLGLRAGMIAMAMSAVTALSISGLIISGWLDVPSSRAVPYSQWLTSGLTFFFLNATLPISLGIFTDRLDLQVKREKALLDEITEANRRLAEENEGRRAAEALLKRSDKSLRALTEELEARVAKRTAELSEANRSLALEIEERRLTAAALYESQTRYRQLVEHAPSGICEVDFDRMRFSSVNEMMCRILGYTRQEFLALNPIFLFTDETEAKLAHPPGVFSALNITGTGCERRVRTRSGDTVYLLVNTAFLPEAGAPSRAIAVAHDITRLKALELQLQQAQKMEAIGTLAGGIAHDFNNLLMAIQGFTSIVLFDMQENHPSYRHLKSIEQAVGNGKKLTQQILGYARRGTFHKRPIALNPLVRQTIETIGRTRKSITIHQDLAQDLWTLSADEGQMLQVLLNLFINAAEAMPAGGRIHVRTSNTTHEDIRSALYTPAVGRYVKLTVADTGVGMDSRTRERIFEPFFTKKGLGRGTGLGLASVYGIVKSHGGYINVESEEGRGSSFHVYLPAIFGRIAPRADPGQKAVAGSGTILVVDDEEMVLNATAGILEKLGYRVLKSSSGSEALRIYSRPPEPIDLVILDMIMPEMGGAEVFERLRGIDPQVRVLLSSGYSLNTQIAKLLQAGCKGFVQKPHTIESLSVQVNILLAGKRSAEGNPADTVNDGQPPYR